MTLYDSLIVVLLAFAFVILWRSGRFNTRHKARPVPSPLAYRGNFDRTGFAEARKEGRRRSYPPKERPEPLSAYSSIPRRSTPSHGTPSRYRSDNYTDDSTFIAMTALNADSSYRHDPGPTIEHSSHCGTSHTSDHSSYTSDHGCSSTSSGGSCDGGSCGSE